jgi:heme-degrading monooxygenase HmoA
MAVLAIFEAAGVSPAQYDEANEILGIHGDEDAPKGLISHVAGFSGDRLVVCDVWESAEALQRFFDEGAGEAIAQAGIPAEEPRVIPVHSLIAQGAGTKARVILIADLDAFTPEVYDRMTSGMDAHAGDGSNHPAVSHVAAVNERGGLCVVDIWDSSESFQRFMETQISAEEAAKLGPFEPRFVPVYNRLRGRAGQNV